MKKTTLEITYIENGETVIESKTGYIFPAKTNDDIEIELFAFKDGTGWTAIEPISTAFVSYGSSRNYVMAYAKENVESMSYNDFIKGN